MSNAPRKWTALVLAGQRPSGEPLADHFGQKFKAHVPLGGLPMLSRVVDTLLLTPQIGRVIVLAQDAAVMCALKSRESVTFIATGGGISSSLLAVLEADLDIWPALVTTADHPLLTEEIVSAFLADAADCDFAIGMVERKILEAAYPHNRRTWLKLRNGQWSGANLFAFNHTSACAALRLWADVEQDRKKMAKVFARFGPVLAMRAFTRTISLEAGLAKAGRRLGFDAKLVRLPFAEAAIDIDKLSDHTLAETILQDRAIASTVMNSTCDLPKCSKD